MKDEKLYGIRREINGIKNRIDVLLCEVSIMSKDLQLLQKDVDFHALRKKRMKLVNKTKNKEDNKYNPYDFDLEA